MQSIPVHELANGQYVYQERSGQYSHQRPGSQEWCENHDSVEDAIRCYTQQSEAFAKASKKP